MNDRNKVAVELETAIVDAIYPIAEKYRMSPEEVVGCLRVVQDSLVVMPKILEFMQGSLGKLAAKSSQSKN